MLVSEKLHLSFPSLQEILFVKTNVFPTLGSFINLDKNLPCSRTVTIKSNSFFSPDHESFIGDFEYLVFEIADPQLNTSLHVNPHMSVVIGQITVPYTPNL